MGYSKPAYPYAEAVSGLQAVIPGWCEARRVGALRFVYFLVGNGRRTTHKSPLGKVAKWGWKIAEEAREAKEALLVT